MYVEIDGQKFLNSKALMTDLYLFANTRANGGKIFDVDGNTGKLVVIAPDNSMEEQVYMAKAIGFNNKIINEFLAANSSKDVSLRIESSNLYSHITGEKTTFDIMKLSEDVKELIAQGAYVSLSEHYAQSKPIKFINLDGGFCHSTTNWNPFEGHITTVVDVTEEGFVVVSWGGKYLVKFEDLEYNNCDFDWQTIEFHKK